MPSMVINMNDNQLNSLADLSAFLLGTTTVEFALAADERYAFIERTLRRFGYAGLRRTDKAVVLRFLERVSGYSRQQLTRLVQRTRNGAPLATRYRAPKGFARTYTAADVALLAATDALHGTLSGPATKKLMERVEIPGHVKPAFRRMGSHYSGPCEASAGARLRWVILAVFAARFLWLNRGFLCDRFVRCCGCILMRDSARTSTGSRLNTVRLDEFRP